MKRKIFWLSVPVFLGLLIAGLAVAVPAQAGKLVQEPDPTHHDPPPGEETYGVVENIPNFLVGSWTVDGVVYTASRETHFSMEEGPFYNGACVKVRYDPDSNFAYAIKTAESEECGGEAELQFVGLIEQVPEPDTGTLHHDPGISGTWLISGTEFVSTFDTELETDHGPLEVGACAKVEYRVVNGVNMADEISSEKLYHCFGQVSFNQAYGYVVTFPDNLYGAWVISDSVGMTLTFETTPSTRFHIQHYPLETEACIRVKYFNEEGINYATSVKTSNPRHCEGYLIEPQPLSKIYATVDSLPTTGTFSGTWVLAGVSFTATEQTRIEEEEGPLAVGVCAEAKYDPTNGAMLFRKVESEEAQDCQDWNGAPRFKLFGVVESMPTGGFIGTWQVSGVSFSVTSDTMLESRHGNFAIGAYVKVYFTYDSVSGRTAQLVKTHVAPGCGRWNYRGRFDGWASDSSGDQIVLDGNTYSADPDIDVPDGLQEGQMVWFNVYQDPEGMFVTQVSLDQSLYLPMIQQ